MSTPSVGERAGAFAVAAAIGLALLRKAVLLRYMNAQTQEPLP